jgi:hypothetical protein
VLLNATNGSAELGVELASIVRTRVLAAPPAIEPPGPAPGHCLPLLGVYARPDWAAGCSVFNGETGI